MTIIVAAVTEKNGVVMAADNLTSAGWKKIQHASPKIWVTDQFVAGAAGCKRTGQVIQHHVTWPKYRPDEDSELETWLIKSLIPAIRSGASGHGVVKNESGMESLEATLLVAVGDHHIAEVDQRGCVTIETGRMAIGSGYAEALGRLGDTGPWTEEDVIDAVRRAIRVNSGCGGPISVVDTKTLTVRTVDADVN